MFNVLKVDWTIVKPIQNENCSIWELFSFSFQWKQIFFSSGMRQLFNQHSVYDCHVWRLNLPGGGFFSKSLFLYNFTAPSGKKKRARIVPVGDSVYQVEWKPVEAGQTHTEIWFCFESPKCNRCNTLQKRQQETFLTPGTHFLSWSLLLWNQRAIISAAFQANITSMYACTDRAWLTVRSAAMSVIQI